MPDLTDKALDALVKPLEWFEAQLPSRGGGKYTANGYTLRKIEGLWLLDFAGEGKTAWRWVDLDAAKAAAQADHTARSLSALNLDALTSLRGGAEAMRERAARIVLQCHAGEYWYRNHMAISPEMLAEAIRALPLPSDTDPGDFPGSHTSQPGEASVSSAPAHDPVAEAARALLADDIAISKMAQAIHDGPLGADDEWFSASSPQGAWCIDAVRAALRARARARIEEKIHDRP